MLEKYPTADSSLKKLKLKTNFHTYFMVKFGSNMTYLRNQT